MTLSRRRLSLLILVFHIMLSIVAAKRLRLRNELRKCGSRRRRFNRFVQRKVHSYVLVTNDDSSTTSKVTARGGVVQSSLRSSETSDQEADRDPSIVRIYNVLCKALKDATRAKDRKYFDTFEVKYGKISEKSRVTIPTSVDVVSSKGNISINYKVSDFRMGRAPDSDTVGGLIGDDTAASRISKNKGLWDSQFPGGRSRDYTFITSWQCRCDDKRTRKRKVTVVGGRIVSVNYVDDTDEVVPKEVVGGTKTIGDLFDEFAAGVDEWNVLDVQYETKIGYPSTIYIDEDASIADDEQNFIIESVELLADGTASICPAEDELMSNIGGSCGKQRDGLMCTIGSESCCGKNYVSLKCTCEGGYWMCLNTDRCMVPSCP